MDSDRIEQTSCKAPAKPLNTAGTGTITVWLLWVAMLALLLAQHWRASLHPHFLPLSLLLFGIVLATIYTLGVCLRHFVTDRNRSRALVWSLATTTPLLFCILFVVYLGLRSWDRTYVPNDLAYSLGTLAGAALMDGDARFRYPNRVETARLVMMYDAVDDPDRHAGKADQYVAKLVEVLGAKLRSKIHWARGPLLGIHAAELRGLVLGSNEHRFVTNLDRHELAHAVLHQLTDRDNDPPAFLEEGWAEWASGMRPERPRRYLLTRQLAQKVLAIRDDGSALTLPQLASPEWYHWHTRLGYTGPPYEQGGALVDFLLREFGVERFLDLYNTSRSETFASDFQRVLGVDLDTFEDRFWQDAEAVASFRKFQGEKPSREQLTDVLREALEQYEERIPNEYSLYVTEVRDVLEAMRALGYEAPNQELVAALKDNRRGVRVAAARILFWSGPYAKEAVPALIEALKDEDNEVNGVRYWSLQALGEIGADARESVPRITPILKDENHVLRATAIYVLGKIGPDAKEALPAILQGQNDRETLVREVTMSALSRIAPEHGQTARVLNEALMDPSDRVRTSAGLALLRTGQQIEPAFAIAMGSEDLETRRMATKQLSLLDSLPTMLRPILLKLVEDKDAEIRQAAAIALEKANGKVTTGSKNN